jgi:hypothetical protein
MFHVLFALDGSRAGSPSGSDDRGPFHPIGRPRRSTGSRERVYVRSRPVTAVRSVPDPPGSAPFLGDPCGGGLLTAVPGRDEHLRPSVLPRHVAAPPPGPPPLGPYSIPGAGVRYPCRMDRGTTRRPGPRTLPGLPGGPRPPRSSPGGQPEDWPFDRYAGGGRQPTQRRAPGNNGQSGRKRLASGSCRVGGGRPTAAPAAPPR